MYLLYFFRCRWPHFIKFKSHWDFFNHPKEIDRWEALKRITRSLNIYDTCFHSLFKRNCIVQTKNEKKNLGDNYTCLDVLRECFCVFVAFEVLIHLVQYPRKRGGNCKAILIHWATLKEEREEKCYSKLDYIMTTVSRNQSVVTLIKNKIVCN